MRLRRERPLLIGHRGAPERAPENTVASFRAALDDGLDGIEIDVHRTRDGVLAVHHDPATAGGTRIAASAWADLHRTHPDLPRMEEVLELMEGYGDRYLNIELKSPPARPDGREDALADALRGWRDDAARRTWISCFDVDALRVLRQRDVPVPTALLLWDVAAAPPEGALAALGVAGVHAERRLATRERIARWHAEGLFVFAWTVNDVETARALIEAGIDGLIGDHPDRLRASLS